MKKGFTIVEILIAISIIGILLAIAVPAYIGMKARQAKAVQAIQHQQHYSDDSTSQGPVPRK